MLKTLRLEHHSDQSFASRALWLLLLAATIFLLQACATSLPVYHGLKYCNVGDTAITVERIQYGRIGLPAYPIAIHKGDASCLSGSSTTSDMTIPEIMQVTWKTADMKSHIVNVPVRSRIKSIANFHSVIVKFNADKIYVIERLRFGVGNEHDIQIYP